MWLIGCETADETARHCRECGAMGRVRSSWLYVFNWMLGGADDVRYDYASGYKELLDRIAALR